jgi:hypothetical protein
MSEPSVELPAAPAYVATARLFVAAVARHFGLEEADVDDARLAVSEVFAAALASRRAEDPQGSVTVAVASHGGGAIGFRMDVPAALPLPGDQDDAPADRFDGDDTAAVATSLRLVRSLFPDATIDTGRAGRTVVEFTAATGEEDAAAEQTAAGR